MQEPLVLRGPDMPGDALPYRTIGPFNKDDIPKGLWREHRLKADVWAILTIEAGSIRFCWDDDEGGDVLLQAGAQIVVPPTIPHHLEDVAAVTVSLTFWAVPSDQTKAAVPYSPAVSMPGDGS